MLQVVALFPISHPHLQALQEAIRNNGQGADPAHKTATLGKNPEVPTSFLPDRDRELAEERMREQLKMEYELRQQVLCPSSSSLLDSMPK